MRKFYEKWIEEIILKVGFSCYNFDIFVHIFRYRKYNTDTLCFVGDAFRVFLYRKLRPF